PARPPGAGRPAPAACRTETARRRPGPTPCTSSPDHRCRGRHQRSRWVVSSGGWSLSSGGGSVDRERGRGAAAGVGTAVHDPDAGDEGRGAGPRVAGDLDRVREGAVGSGRGGCLDELALAALLERDDVLLLGVEAAADGGHPVTRGVGRLL